MTEPTKMQNRPTPRGPDLAHAARGLTAIGLLAGLLASAPAQAAGWYLGELGTRALGRGGADIVNPEDPSAIWLNPAAITNGHGLQLRIDGTFVFANSEFIRDCGERNDCGPIDVERDYGDGRVYVVDGDARDEADDEFIFFPNSDNLGKFGQPSNLDGHALLNQALVQPIPEIWLTWHLDTFGLDGVAFGAGIYAPQAGAFQFGEEEFSRYTLIDRQLLEVYYGVTAAYRFRNWIAVGASVQGVSAGVNQNVKLPADPYGNENPDYDITTHVEATQHFIPSANFGMWTNPFSGLEFGGSVQLGRTVEARGPMTLTAFGPEVQALMDGGLVDIVQEDPQAFVNFNLAPIYRVGVKYGRSDLFGSGIGFDVETDFVYEDWTAYDHIYLETTGIGISLSGNPAEPLDPVIQPKDYVGAFSTRIGGELTFLDEMIAARSGLWYESSAIPNSTYAVDLLNGEQVGVGLGAGAKLFGVRVDVGYAHVFLFDRVVGDESIVHTAAVPAGIGNAEPRTRIAMGSYKTGYDMLSISLTVMMDEMFGIGAFAEDDAPRIEHPPEAAPTEAPAESPTESPAESPAEEGADAPLPNEEGAPAPR